MRSFLSLLLLPSLWASGDEIPWIGPDPSRPDIKLVDDAHKKFREERSALKARYRARFGQAMKHADRVELFLLSFTLEEVGEHTYKADEDSGLRVIDRDKYFYIEP